MLELASVTLKTWVKSPGLTFYHKYYESYVLLTILFIWLSSHFLLVLRCFFNYKISVKTDFLDPENLGKDTKIDFLLQILRKLWRTEDLGHLVQSAILLFCLYNRKVAHGCWGGIYLVVVHDMLSTTSVKPVYNDRSKDQKSAVFIDR